jgi:diguanylate cyclase (GGDEF)-like protein
MEQVFIEKAIRDSSQISIFLFDIDNFKHYNDTNGHDAGDRLLIELTALVNSITRKNAVFSRYGGEEFIVMLPGISKEDTFIYAERVREKISQHPFFNRESQPLGCVSVSGGVTTFPDDANTLAKTIQLADESLYQAKEEGRNRVMVYKPQHFSYHTMVENLPDNSQVPDLQEM